MIIEKKDMETSNDFVMMHRMHQRGTDMGIAPAFRRIGLSRWGSAWVVALLVGLTAGSAMGQSAPTPLIAEKTRHVTAVDSGDDQGALRIDGQARRVDTQPVAIEGGKAYTLTLPARVESDFVIEHNDRAVLLTLDSHRFARTSTYSLVFLDQDNKEISPFGYGHRGFFLTQNWYDYKMSFYTPAGAVAMKLRIEPAKRPVFVRSLELTPVSDESRVVLNPDFSMGELNYSGWSATREGRLMKRADGVVVFKPGYGGSSSVFPLEAGANYTATAKGTGGTINMVYYDEAGKQLHSRFLTRPTAKGETAVAFTPPEGTHFGKLVTYSINALESCHIVKVSGSGQ